MVLLFCNTKYDILTASFKKPQSLFPLQFLHHQGALKQLYHLGGPDWRNGTEDAFSLSLLYILGDS